MCRKIIFQKQEINNNKKKSVKNKTTSSLVPMEYLRAKTFKDKDLIETYLNVRFNTEDKIPQIGPVENPLSVRRGQMRMLNNGNNIGPFKSAYVLILTDPSEDGMVNIVPMFYVPEYHIPKDIAKVFSGKLDIKFRMNHVLGFAECWNLSSYPVKYLEQSWMVSSQMMDMVYHILLEIYEEKDGMLIERFKPEDLNADGVLREFRMLEMSIIGNQFILPANLAVADEIEHGEIINI